jgi:hypothetical protein
MLKKVMLYGLSFGSASAALLLIQYFNGLYRDRTLASSLPVLGSVVISILSVVLVIRALRRENPGSLMMGKALFAGLLTSALLASVTVLAYEYLLENHPAIMNDYRNLLAERVKAAGKDAANFDVDAYMSFGSFLRWQFSMNLSIGMLVASATFLISSRGNGRA